jgi:peptidoglycan DL-endopeptidase CwlO
MNKKLTALSTTIIFGLGSAFAAPSVMAKSNLPGIQARISNADSQISQYQSELDKLNDQVLRVEKAINDNNRLMVDTETKMKDSQAEVQQLQKDVSTINVRIEKRNEVLKKRAQTMQETGGDVNYIDVLLGASSFKDFIDRVGAVTTIVQADQDAMNKQEADKKEVEKKKASVESKLADLKSMKEDLVGMREGILEQKTQNDALKAELQKKQHDKLAEKDQLQQQAQLQQAQLQQAQLKKQAQKLAPKIEPTTDTQSSTNTNSNTNLNLNTNSSVTSSPSTSESINVSVPNSNGSTNDVLTAGYKYIGNSVYVFGGGRSAYDIANGRFDCSSFVHWAFAQAGYSIGSSTDSLKNEGSRVSVSEMQPGDLVFFDTYKTDGHVGIYLGGGKFIGSQSSTGVAIANLTSGYWKSHFNGRVIRILN